MTHMNTGFVMDDTLHVDPSSLPKLAPDKDMKLEQKLEAVFNKYHGQETQAQATADANVK